MNIINSKILRSQRFALYLGFALVGVLIALFILYALLVNKTVMNVVARESAEEKIAELSTRVGELEFEEIGMKKAINMEMARSLGFSEEQNIRFVPRTLADNGLSLNR